MLAGSILNGASVHHADVEIKNWGNRSEENEIMRTKRIEFGDFPFNNYANARRGLDNLYRKKIAELRNNDTLSAEDKQRRLDELEHEYMGEAANLNKRFGIN